MGNDSRNYYTGTSGLLLPVPNKEHYPEEFRQGSRLRYYASLMNSIEVNSSFYKIPQRTTVARWAADVPNGFRFTFKLFKEVTHCSGLLFQERLLEQFMDVIAAVDNKRGCLLVQFPPSVRMAQLVHIGKLMALLRQLDPDGLWKIALEFRDPSLYNEDVYDLLRQFQMGMVVHDKPPAATPIVVQITDFIYLRFHSPDGSYRGSYSDGLLGEYAMYVSEWMAEGKQVYAYFNNTIGGAYENMHVMRGMLFDNLR